MRIVMGSKQIRKTINAAIATFAIILLISIRGNVAKPSFVLFCTIFSLVIFSYQIFSIYKITGEIFDLSIIFLASFYIFQNGQLLLIALGIDFYMYYINTLKSFTGDVVLFSALSNIVAGLAGVIVARGPDQYKKYHSSVDLYSERSVVRAASWGLLVMGAVSYPMIIIKFFRYALSGGYYAVRTFEASLPSIVSLTDYLFVLFSFLFIIFTENKWARKVVVFLTFIWFVLTALCGDRTTGITGLLMLTYVGYIKQKDTKKKRRDTIKLVIVGFILILFIRVAYVFRMGGSVREAIIGSTGSLFIGLFEELGFSGFPLFMMMNIVPSIEPFQYGKQYLLSFFAAIFPESLDFTGIVANLTQDWGIYSQWIDKHYSEYSFGVGFSLNAEAYINFGWFGIIAIFFLMIVVLSNLSKASGQKKLGSKYGIYKVTVLLFVWMTLPRRSSYYIWNGLFWCVFMMGLYLRVMCLKIKKKR